MKMISVKLTNEVLFAVVHSFAFASNYFFCTELIPEVVRLQTATKSRNYVRVESLYNHFFFNPLLSLKRM